MKKLLLLGIIACLLVCMSCSVYASGVNPITFSGGSADVSGIDKIGGVVIGSIQAIGSMISVAVLIYVGIRFMIAAPSEKAQLKGMLIPYIVGAVIVFATANLADIIYKVAKQMFP